MVYGFQKITTLNEDFFNSIENLSLHEIAYTVITNLVDLELPKILLKASLKNALRFQLN